MQFRIRNQKDLAAGLIYVCAGAGFGLGALNYKLGDAARMGPGWFPFWVGMLLVAVGLFTVLGAAGPLAQPEKVQRPDLRTMAWILGSVVVFGLLLQPAGLVIALVALVIISSLASHEFGWRGAIANAVILTLFSLGAFIWGIHLQIPLWPAFID
ncbi:MAG TPA: tripartite tricarboxylate transporter TctB family protein [Ramlibacter sp.]|nr:tripartite tricarboxylate transporter TctB family protein [Ramlibacter sp.]